jgi:glycine oxidase
MTPDVVIVGGGVIGCAIAYALSHARAGRVVVLERPPRPGDASRAAAGLLAVASSRAPGGVLFELRRASAACFPEWVEALREQTGADVEYRTAGLLELAFTPDEVERLRGLVERRQAQGFRIQWLDRAAVRAAEPAVGPTVSAGALFADDRAVHPVRLLEALRGAASASGVVFRAAAVTAVEHTAGRVLALVAGGERVSAGHVVLAAGVWSQEIGALCGARMPVRPDKGEMLALRPERPLTHAVAWGDGYLVPRADGEVWVGSTSNRGDDPPTVRAESLALLSSRALRMAPGLAGAAVVRLWAGLRPCSTIRRPIIGPLRGYENVLVATGHHRSGILLAPITGQLVAELLTQGRTSIDLQPFGYRPR